MAKHRRRACDRLKRQAQALFWQYAAGCPLASAAAVSAYKASLVEFLEYAAVEHHIGRLTQIRKRHLEAYIRFLLRRRYSKRLIAKRVYGVCFWLSFLDPDGAQLPDFDRLCEGEPWLSDARLTGWPPV